MRYFFNKLKSRRSVGDSAPKPPLASGGWGLCRRLGALPPAPGLLFPLNLRVNF